MTSSDGKVDGEHEDEGLNRIERMDREHVFGTWSYQSEVEPTQVVSTNGARFTDAAGNEFVDFSDQFALSS